MAREIERKFLVRGLGWKQLAHRATGYRQGYIPAEGPVTVRVRIAGTDAFVTIKGPTEGIGRDEYEYPIPLADAQAMLDHLCAHPLIEKTRYLVRHGDLLWEVDEFGGDNQGLIVAEVELDDPDRNIDLPPWVDAEVTGDPRYYNAALARHPYTRW